MWPKPLQTVGHAGGGRGQLEGQPRGEQPRACPAGSDKSLEAVLALPRCSALPCGAACHACVAWTLIDLAADKPPHCPAAGSCDRRG